MTYAEKQHYFNENAQKGDKERLVKFLSGKASRRTIFDAMKNQSQYLPAKHQFVIDEAYKLLMKRATLGESIAYFTNA